LYEILNLKNIQYLQTYFKEQPIVKITLAQCQKLINDIVEQGKGKTADEVYSLMNVIFQYAKDNGYFDKDFWNKNSNKYLHLLNF
jgi:hypothetical protein